MKTQTLVRGSGYFEEMWGWGQDVGIAVRSASTGMECRKMDGWGARALGGRGASLGEGRDLAGTGTSTGFGSAEAAGRALRKPIHSGSPADATGRALSWNPRGWPEARSMLTRDVVPGNC
jgi:hypothetical protein